MTDVLTVSFDKNEKNNETGLCVCRTYSDKEVYVLKTAHGDRADTLYRYLTDPSVMANQTVTEFADKCMDCGKRMAVVDLIKEISDICSKADTCLEGCPFFDPMGDGCIFFHNTPSSWDTDAIQKVLTNRKEDSYE